MTETRTAGVPPASGLREVEVRVPATPEHLATVRVVAADLAMRADFDLDSIADLKLAVDEACATLVGLARSGVPLVCRFEVDVDEIRVEVNVLAANGVAPSQNSFGWQVLNALTDSVNTSVSPAAADPGGHLVRIQLVKQRARMVDG